MIDLNVACRVLEPVEVPLPLVLEVEPGYGTHGVVVLQLPNFFVLELTVLGNGVRLFVAFVERQLWNH